MIKAHVSKHAISILWALGIVMLAGSGCRSKSAPASGSEAKPPEGSAGANGGDVVISMAEQTAQHIQVEAAVMSSEPGLLRVPGKIALPDNATWRVGVLVEGRVERVYANLGDYVHQGQLLARMHSHDVHEAQAAYRSASADRARLDSAAALAQKNYDRTQRLYDLKAASTMEVEQARQELVNAQTALQNGEITLQAARVHLEDTLGVKPALTDTTGDAELVPILAPASGYILQKNVTPGVTITPSTDAFVIGALQRLWMLASVSEDNLMKIKVGQVAHISLPDVPNQQFTGKVVNLGQQFDPTTRLIPVRIEIENTKGFLRPEMLATAEIAVGESQPMLLIPQDAVQQVNGEDVVFVRKGADHFSVRAIQSGGIIQGRVRIVEGLKAGEEVVTRGSFLVKSQLLRASIGD